MSELQGLQSRLQDFRQLGVQILAVSVDSVDKNREVVDKLGLEFPILSDSDRRIIDSWGVRHEGAGIDGSAVARPAIFLVDGSARVVWRDLTDNFRVRARPDRLLEVIASY